MVGSLDHTSPLSNSLASSESLSISLRSVTEFRNLHPLVAAAQQTTDNVTKPTTTALAGPSTASGSGSGTSRQPVSDDIPVPATSQYVHHHLHHPQQQQQQQQQSQQHHHHQK